MAFDRRLDHGLRAQNIVVSSCQYFAAEQNRSEKSSASGWIHGRVANDRRCEDSELPPDGHPDSSAPVETVYQEALAVRYLRLACQRSRAQHQAYPVLDDAEKFSGGYHHYRGTVGQFLWQSLLLSRLLHSWGTLAALDSQDVCSSIHSNHWMLESRNAESHIWLDCILPGSCAVD